MGALRPDLEPFKWKPGVSPNPGGKPVAARNRLQGAFLKALADDFDQHGKKAIEACRAQDPSAYVRAIVALMPKELEISRGLDELSDEQLDAALIAARALLAASDTREGAGEAQGTEPAAGLPAVHEAG